MLNPGGMISMGDLADNYLKYAERAFKLTREGDVSPNYRRLTMVLGLMEKYRSMPVNQFGPDDLADVQQALVASR